jgi:DNA-binding transcriptional MerR regulator
MRTSELAKQFGVHPNTIRLYEEWGYLPPIPRDPAGQRIFTEKHVEQMRLARCILHEAPRSGPQFKASYKEMVWLACADQLQLAITQARKHLTMVKSAQGHATDALAFLRDTLPEHVAHLAVPPLNIQQAAALIGISVPILRRWEHFQLIHIPRNPTNKYRIFGRDEIGWLLVIQSLRQAGSKISACHKLIDQYQKDNKRSLCDAIDGCILLFIEHEAHTNKVIDQLQRMTTLQ